MPFANTTKQGKECKNAGMQDFVLEVLLAKLSVSVPFI
jgi:hypothetical protein